jgi:hypothetical protein
VFLGLQSLRSLADQLKVPLYLRPVEDALIWWSPLLWLPLLSFVFFAFPIGWAYWLVEPERRAIQKAAPSAAANAAQERSAIPPVAGAVLVFVASLALAIVMWGTAIAVVWSCIAIVALLALGFWQLARRKWRESEVPKGKELRPHGRLVKADRTGLSLAHAALAQVTYVDTGATSWLLYVKPTLTGREPVDLLEYHSSHPDFPHETTIDQYFDEAQWESYRRLGQYISDVLFDKVDRLLPEDDRKPEGTLLKQWAWRASEQVQKKDGRLPTYS